MSAAPDAGGFASQSITPARLALKVDAATLRGTELGVPRIARALERYGAGATFLFSVGPDRTGRAIGGVLRRALALRHGRSATPTHFGPRNMLYGTLLPGPDIGRRCADTLRAVRDAGFETGIHAWDATEWRRHAAGAGAEWTAERMRRALDRFESILGTPPRVHGAAGWRTSVHSLRLTQRLGFDFCSDTRGSCPYIPIIDAEIVACPQIPTTLPTIAEVRAGSAADAGSVAERMLRIAAETPASAGHVLTLQAESEGFAQLPVLEHLLAAWAAAGVRILSLGAYLEAAGASTLPRHRIAFDRGGDHAVTVQGPEFLPRAARACA